MALKVKAVERKIKFNKNDEGVYRYSIHAARVVHCADAGEGNQGSASPLRMQPENDAGPFWWRFGKEGYQNCINLLDICLKI